MDVKRLLNVVIVLFGLSNMSVIASPGVEGQSYAGVQFAKGSYEESGFEDLNPTAIVGRLGHKFNKSFSAEARLGIGLQDDDINVLGFDVSLELDSLIGVYGVGHIDVIEAVSIYGLVGVTKAEATAKVSQFGISESDDDADLSYGVGANFDINDKVVVNVEYMQYLSKSEFDFSAFAFGLAFGF